MRILSKIVLSFVVLLIISYFALWAIVDFRGKGLLENIVKENTGYDLEIGSLRFSPPLGVVCKDVSSKGFRAKMIEASLHPGLLFIRGLALGSLKIADANIDIVKREDEIILPVFGLIPLAVVQELPSSGGRSTNTLKDKDSRSSFNFSVGKVLLDNVSVNFRDDSKDKNFRASLSGIYGFIDNIEYPLLHRVEVNLLSGMKVKEVELDDNVSIRGWVDFSTKSMDVNLKLRQIPYNEFAAYYPSFWRPHNLGLTKAIFSLDTDFVSEYNDLTIEGTLSLLEYEFQVTQDNQTKVAIAKGLLGMFGRNKEHPGFNFKIKSKFDNPRIDFSKITAQFDSDVSKTGVAVAVGKEVLKGAAKGTINKSAETTKKVIDVSTETTKKAIDVTGKAIGEVLRTPERAGEVIKNAGDVLESMFTGKKQENPKPPQNNTVGN